MRIVSNHGFAGRADRSTARIAASVCLVFALGACSDASLTSAPARPPHPPTPLGLVEITIAGVGTPGQTASARIVGPTLAPGVEATFSPPDGGTGAGGIQLQAVSTGTFTVGSRGAGGERYFYATYKVRNAQTNGTAYTTPRQNLTFLAVATSSTINATSMSKLLRFDGTAADTAIAPEVTPTGLVHQSAQGTIVATAPDVLQALTESDVAAITAPPTVTTIFPYGFVTDNPATPNSRALPASPAVDQFDGTVTFAFKYPLQATAADDPFTVTAMFLALDDGITRVTQSIEEQDSAAQDAFESRATALGATGVTLLAGGAYSGSAAPDTLCSLRVAGTAAAPTAYDFNATGEPALAPNPYTGAGQFVSPNASFGARFGSPISNASAATFIVTGLESGRHFVGQTYGGAATDSVSTPAGTFLPGEEVAVTLTRALGSGCQTPWSARLRVASQTSSVGGTFAARTDFPAASQPSRLVIADVSGDGRPDAIVANSGSANVSVFLNNGAGGFSARTDYPTGGRTFAAAVGDFNDDGHPDIAVTDVGDTTTTSDTTGTNISVLLGNGDGTFQAPVNYAVGTEPRDIITADFNGDGKLDLAVTNFLTGTISVLLGNGDGTFAPKVDYATAGSPNALAVGDFNHDGILDLVTVSDISSAVASVYLGKGDGTFNAKVDYAVAGNAFDVKVGDFNGDGISDLAVTSALTSVESILLGNGDGTFAPKVDNRVASLANDATVADFDGDGKLDIAVSSTTLTSTLSVLMGNGDGTFQTPIQITTASKPAGIASADVNGDGKIDIVITNSGAGTISLFLRN